MMNQPVTLTADTAIRIGKTTRTVEGTGTKSNEHSMLYHVPKSPYPIGRNFSFGMSFPSVLGYPGNLSTVVALTPGPIRTSEGGLYVVPSTSVTLAHSTSFYQLCLYGTYASNLSLVAVSASSEEDITNIATSNPYNVWLYTVRMRSGWIDSVIPRNWSGISESSSTVSTDDNPVLDDGYCYKCPRRYNGGVEDTDSGTHPDGTDSGIHPGDTVSEAHPGSSDGGVVAGDTLHPYVCPPCLYGKELPPH